MTTSDTTSFRAVGLISGTSFDAVETAAVDLTPDGDTLVCDILGHVSVPFPPDLALAVGRVLPPATTSIEDVCRLDTALGQHFAAAAAQAVGQLCDGRADVVCSHGQTVFHWVDGGAALGTLQLGEAAWIAERTGLTVVSDVRSRDVASGGQGAPLASLLDVLLLGSRGDAVRAALNLGGIANVTILDPRRPPLAFDTGPANALMDAAVRWLTDGAEDFDRDGRRAAAGVADEALLARLLAEPYYAAPAPKSTGKELFHLDYLLDILDGQAIEPNDLLATLAALTAETVAAAVRPAGVAEIMASGGGTRNPVLMAELARRLPGVGIRGSDEFGLPETGKEAILMAVIGFLTLHGLPGTVPSCTGARHASVLGSITPGARPWRRLDVASMPRALVIRQPGAH